MVREIINVQIGQAGNQIGEAFWNTVLQEHGLDLDGRYIGHDDIERTRAGVYFSEVEGQKYIPRSVQVDLETGVLNRLKSGRLSKLFRPDTFVAGEPGAGNNFAKVFHTTTFKLRISHQDSCWFRDVNYTEGAELVEEITDVLRKQVEAADSFQGFQFIHSLGGGTGSGLGTLLSAKLREEVPDCMISTFSILPSAASETVVEPYNTILAMHQLTEHSDLTFCIDNEALYSISNRLGYTNPDFAHLNEVVATVMAGVSTSLRFPGQLNGDLRKLAMNTIPFPRLHFLAASQAPIVAPGSRSFQGLSVPELTASLFDKKNMLAAIDPMQGRYLTAAMIYRGNIQSRDAEGAVQDVRTKRSDLFVPYIPDNISITLCSVPPVGQKQSATCVGNTTSIQDVLRRTHVQFAAMFKRRAFMHWYSGEGMDEMEFTEAESNVLDLMSEYQQYQEASAEDEEYEEEDSRYGETVPGGSMQAYEDSVAPSEY